MGAVHRMMRTAQLLCVFAVVVAVGMGAEIGEEVSMLDEADSRLGEVHMLETPQETALGKAKEKTEELMKANEAEKNETTKKAEAALEEAKKALVNAEKKAAKKNEAVKKTFENLKTKIVGDLNGKAKVAKEKATEKKKEAEKIAEKLHSKTEGTMQAWA